MPAGTEHPGNEYHAIAYGRTVDVWTPFQFDPSETSQRGSHYLEGIGRLKDGVTAGAAQEELSAIQRDLSKLYDVEKRWHVRAPGLNEEIAGASRPVLLMWLGAVGMVLLIACANAANLLAGPGREPEAGAGGAAGAGDSAGAARAATADGKPDDRVGRQSSSTWSPGPVTTALHGTICA
jgi:hypothetical protein